MLQSNTKTAEMMSLDFEHPRYLFPELIFRAPNRPKKRVVQIWRLSLQRFICITPSEVMVNPGFTVFLGKSLRGVFGPFFFCAGVALEA